MNLQMELALDKDMRRMGRYEADVPYRRFNTSLKDCNPDVFIAAFAQQMELKNYIDPPKWIDYAKTSSAKELAPQNPKWFYIRSAAILRHLYFNPDEGIGRLKRVYASRKRRGCAPNHTCPASGKIIRTIVQQLEANGFLEKSKDNKGRRLSRRGCNIVNEFARHLTRSLLEKGAAE
ncbi:40S ribosomal protein S19-A [Babesia sp. Xinjiang]|uniref:40S ribosomal protein S19-A n=1 Tax=Babesia sp. Xinjiang TaxID=462227 RepID=UPI000A25E1A8|nr:40S ribosomal protein S19-A [Babesia sp. Xinjiang]ORM42289.1 40S ribosomal protein S19-A [Babesia sp. Xinjiang]